MKMIPVSEEILKKMYDKHWPKCPLDPIISQNPDLSKISSIPDNEKSDIKK